jgi:glycosyltransferase involved in cell wall biosynthesis
MSISLLEAMAAGRPIIATSIGGNREATDDGEAALLVPACSPASLSAAILRLANCPQEASRLARKAKEIHASRYTASRMTADYRELYLSLLSERNLMAAAEPQSQEATS